MDRKPVGIAAAYATMRAVKSDIFRNVVSCLSSRDSKIDRAVSGTVWC